jgi:hypothetical protein
MNDNRIEDDLARYEAELKIAQAKAVAAVTEAQALSRIVSALRELGGKNVEKNGATVPDGSTATASEGFAGEIAAVPAGSDAVKRVMGLGASQYDWSMADIIARLAERGWLNMEAKHPEAAVRATVQRLIKSGEIVRVDRGRFRLATGIEPSPIDGEASGVTAPDEDPQVAGWEAR